MKNPKTTISAIFTAIALVPAAIESLHLASMPGWLVTVTMACAFISFIYSGIVSKDAGKDE